MAKKNESYCITVNTTTRGRGQLMADEFYGGNFSTYITYLINLDYQKNKELFSEEQEVNSIKLFNEKIASRKPRKSKKALSTADSQNNVPDEGTTDEHAVSSDEVLVTSIMNIDEVANIQTTNIPDIKVNASNSILADNKGVSNPVANDSNKNTLVSPKVDSVPSPEQEDSCSAEPDEDDILNSY